MPKLTLLVGRKALQVYDLPKDVILVGREDGADIVIDNPSVSRRHAEFRKEGDGWVVVDLGSSNGTFLNGIRLEGPQPVVAGDEVGLGKFSIVFEKEVGEVAPPATKARIPTLGAHEGTMHIKPQEVQELLKDGERKRRAQLAWESGGRKGTFYLADAPALLIGTDSLCDLQVPKAPKHHVLVIHTPKGCEVRNLHWLAKMKVGGRVTSRAVLKDKDVVEVGGLRFTFLADLV